MNQIKSDYIHLKNGIDLVLINIPGATSATTMATVKAGPRYDPLTKTGLSHFVEHMILKGNTQFEDRQLINEYLENRGASLYSFTYHETNKYWIRSASEDIPMAIENLCNLIYEPLLRESDVEEEKKIVKEEVKIVESNPQQGIWELWAETIWPNSSLGRSYIGSNKEIDSFTHEDIYNFWKKNYISDKTTFLVAGDFESEKIKGLLELQIDPSVSSLDSKENIISNNGQEEKIWVKQKDLDTATLAMGFSIKCQNSHDRISLEVLSAYLAGGMSSILRKRIMEKGLTYSVNSYTQQLSDRGYLMILLTTESQNIQKVLDIITQTLEECNSGKIDEKTLEIAKNYLQGNYKVQLDSSYNWAEYYLEQLSSCSFNEVIDLDNLCQEIGKITSNDIKILMNKYYSKEKIRLSVIGKVDTKLVI